MNIITHAILLLASTLTSVNAQHSYPVVGAGPPTEETFIAANQNPLNKTSVVFSGFDLNADPASTKNATTGQWTWNAGLSIIDIDTNKTNYPISQAANSTSNVIDVAYTLDFPGGQLPQQNNTNWTICAYVFSVPWTSAVLGRASSDPGDCSVALGASCVSRIQQSWSGQGLGESECPQAPPFTTYPECNSVSTNGYSIGSWSVMSFLSDVNNKSSTEVGLKSGQIFGYQASASFNASQAQATYSNYSTNLRMVGLTFMPSKAFAANHSGVLNAGQVRTFCTILNKQAQSSNAALKPSAYNTVGAITAAWILSFAWGFM